MYLYPFLFALYPVLALLAHNIHEVSPDVAFRPALISLAVALILFILFGLLQRSLFRAAVSTTLTLVLFFSYGHVYEVLQKVSLAGFILGRHRLLVIIYGLVWIVGLVGLHFRLRPNPTLTQALNVIGLVLLLMPGYQVAASLLTTSFSQRQIEQTFLLNEDAQLSVQGSRPDVYYILLDGYTRADALQRDFNFDNTGFIAALQELGFYVADCSQANYLSTEHSMTSALNMSYIPDLEQRIRSLGLPPEQVWSLLTQSAVRQNLEGLGYQVVAFDSGYQWSRLPGADIYLEYTGKPYQMQLLKPFEYVLLRTTALLIWSDMTFRQLPEYQNTQFKGGEFIYEDHINRQLFILDQLPRLAKVSSPKFVFVHLLLTHVPYNFDPQGNILTDRGFYTGDLIAPVDDEHLMQGYVYGIQFTNYRLLPILRQILADSAEPPVIVIHGDHGLNGDNRQQILNAYYFPNQAYQALSPSITPVNSFRVVFNTFFAGQYPLLEDVTYDYDGRRAADAHPCPAQRNP